jgi:glycosyltransferase involved in cell wall biosynthesis
LDSCYHFLIIGDGSAILKLKNSIPVGKISNIKFIDPVGRPELIKYYLKADILFLHLNNIPAFTRVLPSKIFEYAALGKPIIAGLSGYSENFLKENVPYSYIFKPGNSLEAIECILDSANFKVTNDVINKFIEKYSRESIMDNMAIHIINVIEDRDE